MTSALSDPSSVALVCGFGVLSITGVSLRERIGAIAIAVFGTEVMASERREGYRERLRVARIDSTYRRYGALTRLYAAIAAFIGGAFGATVFGIGLSSPVVRSGLAGIDPTIEPAVALLSPPVVTVLAVLGGGLAAAFGGFGTYWYRWYRPGAKASARERRIDLTFSRTVALLYALSRGGVTVAETMRTLRRHRGVYGAAAAELSLAVRDMDTLGADVLTAVSRVGDRTPSDRFAGFCENLSTVLESGADTASFLREQYERHQREVEARQSAYLEWLATFAEAYVSLLVVGPLFLLTVLIVMGLLSGGIELVLALIVYLFVPVANVGFVITLDGFTGPYRTTTDRIEGHSETTTGERTFSNDRDRESPAGATDDHGELPATDRRTLDRLADYQRKRARKGVLDDPIAALTDRPIRLLYATIPLAVLVVGLRIGLAWRTGALSLAAVDETVIAAAIGVIGSFALVHETRRRRLERLDGRIPEFLDRLANLNGAGISVVDALSRLEGSDLGELNPEIERINRDIALGASVSDALSRFDSRTDTASVTRAVTLLTNAMRASGDVAPVLEIASEEARTNRTRKRKRRQEMATYLAIIYLSFLVFLAIVFVLVVVFMPTIPSPADLGGNGVGGRVVGLSAEQKATYVRILFHAAAVQGVASGFVAGQMSTGDVADGAKHAAVMLAIAFVSFLAFA